MPNTLDDFSDAPLSNRPTLSEDAKLFVDYVETLASDDSTSYAADTLYGIVETVKATGVVTDPQRDAVANIIVGARKRERGRSRRYEGHRRW